MSPELNFDDLKNSFDKRTLGYEKYQTELGESNPRLLNWIGSIDYSGYIREKCLKYLIDNYQSGDENRILLRLEDWVEPVQQLALNWTKNNFYRLLLVEINDNYQLILYLTRKHRLVRGEAINIVNSCLLEKAESVPRQEFYSLNSKLRRYLYELAITQSTTLRSLVVRDKDPNNRMLLIKKFAVDELHSSEYDRLSNDKSALIKKRFLYYQIKHQHQPSQQQLIRLALDKNKGVREIAGYYLGKYYHENIYQLYKSQNDEKFYFIADFTKKEDLDYFFTGITSGNKQVKILCLRAICQINPDYLQQFDIEKMIVENNQFRQLIFTYYLPNLPLAELKKYQNILMSQSKGIGAYLKYLYRRSYWDFIDLALNLIINHADQPILDIIKQFLSSKSIERYQKPSMELKAKITTKLNHLQNYGSSEFQFYCDQIKLEMKHL